MATKPAGHTGHLCGTPGSPGTELERRYTSLGLCQLSWGFQCLSVCFSIPPPRALEAKPKGARKWPVSTTPGAPHPGTILASRSREGPSGAHTKMLSFQKAVWLLCSQRTGPGPLVLEALTEACGFLFPARGFHLPIQCPGEPGVLSRASRASLCPHHLPCTALGAQLGSALALGASQGSDLPADSLALNGTWCPNLTSVGKSSN